MHDGEAACPKPICTSLSRRTMVRISIGRFLAVAVTVLAPRGNIGELYKGITLRVLAHQPHTPLQYAPPPGGWAHDLCLTAFQHSLLMYPSTELSTRQTTDMKDTPEPLTNKEIFMIIIVLLVAGWGIAVLVDTSFFQRLFQ